MNKISQKNLSDNSNILKTGKDTAIFEAVSFTGLPEKHIKFLFESNDLNNFNNFFGFTGNMEKNNIQNNFSISNEILKILNSKDLENDKINELNRLTSYAKNYLTLDSIDLLTGISNLILVNDKKAKEFILGENKLHEFEITNLNESFEFNPINFDNNIDSTKELFENLKDLLSKQNKRWGNAYRLTNTYNGIMYYLENELQRLMLMNDIVTSDSNINISILRNFINDENNPLYKDFSSVSNLCSDIQTLNLDLILLVHHFMINHTEELDFISRSVFNDYKKISGILLSNISSSINKSLLLTDEIKSKLNSMYTDKDKTIYNENIPLIYTLTNNIDYQKFNGINIQFNLSTKSVKDICWFINSTSVSFNLRLRPMFKSYVTKSLELINRVDEARFKLNKFKNGN